MNINFFQTILTVAIGVVAAIATFAGCTTDAAGVVDCSASWLPPVYSTILVMAAAALKVALKFFQGGLPGTALVAPMVPVVPANKSGPGTVTASQVNSGDKK